MNIFYLHKNPKICARLHCDKHVVKMATEYAQLMSTAHRILDGKPYTEITQKGRRITRYLLENDTKEQFIYKASHINHPQNIWVRHSEQNYCWLYKMWIYLCDEYTYRYGKIHKSYSTLCELLNHLPENIPDKPKTKIPLTMPVDVQIPGFAVKSYRKFYATYKKSFCTWQGKLNSRTKPKWMDEQ